MGIELKKWLSLGAVLFVVLVLSAVTATAVMEYAHAGSREGLYGIFLTNGQVYFGNITSETDKKLKLEHIYYIQMKGDQAAGQNSDISLLKLGNELHGPEDYMEINQSNILFIEKLKSDGKVAKAIQDYKK